MNNIKIKIPASFGMLKAFQYIDTEMEKSKAKGSVTLDLTEASFPVGHDFFTVLEKRYKKEIATCLIKSDLPRSAFERYGFHIVSPGTHSEFQKEFPKENILRHNFTALEYVMYELRRVGHFLAFFLEKHRKGKKIIKMPSQNGNFFLIIFGLIVSVSLLLFIFYFAISKTFIYIEPQIIVRPISSNILFSVSTGSSLLSPKNLINMRRESITFEHSMKFTVTAIDTNSISNARGEVILYNELTTEQALKPGTRFITDDGLIFRSEEWIRIPPSRTLNGITELGSVEAFLVADAVDSQGKTIGDRGNIVEGTNMTIPGLKFNRDKIYARAKAGFIGGQDPRVHVLTKDELTRFENLLREQAKKLATESLIKFVRAQNKNKNENFELLMGETIAFDDGKIDMGENIKVGAFADEVDLRMTLTASALFYDKKATVIYLSEIFRNTLLDGTDKEVAIHDDSLRISNIISRAPGDMNMKLTMEMDATITYDFENPINELTRQMKILIAGLDKETAKKRIISTGYVRDVTIKFSPFWMRRVSNNLDNIEFVIHK